MNCLNKFLFGFSIRAVGVLFRIYDLDPEHLVSSSKKKNLSVHEADDPKKSSSNSFCFTPSNLSFDAK
jgi:hypothetical protein